MQHSRKQLRRTRTHRLSPFESLEPRLALDADGIAFGDSPYLSLSFAADGTDVDGRPSRLFDFMDQIAATADWQQSILDAFQTWSIHTNADVAETSDGGQPFGTPGETLGDSRFGDVRVGAIAMRPNVYAVAVSRGFVAGTWSGDLLFNTRARLNNVDEVFRVALHEAGHVFGLEHNQDPASVMYESGISNVTQPSTNDLDNLWAELGYRSPDVNEPNNSLGDRTDIHHSESDGYVGATPLIVHADMGANDVDIYRFNTFEMSSGLVTGDVTFEVRTERLSQLRPHLRVFLDGGSTPILEASASPDEERISVTLTNAPNDQRYYIYVDSIASGLATIGGYSLITTFDNHLLSSPAAIDLYAGPQYRFLDQRAIEDIFEGDFEGVVPLFGDDMHTNDTLVTATPLETTVGFVPGAKYQAIGSISDATDIDFYQIRSADLAPSNVMSILVERIDGSNFPSIDVTAYDHSGSALPHRNLIHHGGRVLVQLENVQPDANHYLRIASATGDTGNYRLTVISGTQAESLEVIASGVIPTGTQSFSAMYTVQRRQELTMFAFEGHPANSPTQGVRVTLETLAGTPLVQLEGSAVSFISTDSQILDPGTYRLRVEKTIDLDQPLDFKVLAAVITDPLAVPRILKDVAIVKVSGFDDPFVFPNQRGGGDVGVDRGGPPPSGLPQPQPIVSILPGGLTENARKASVRRTPTQPTQATSLGNSRGQQFHDLRGEQA